MYRVWGPTFSLSPDLKGLNSSMGSSPAELLELEIYTALKAWLIVLGFVEVAAVLKVQLKPTHYLGCTPGLGAVPYLPLLFCESPSDFGCSAPT